MSHLMFCGGCNLEKPIEDFNWKNKAKGTKQRHCKTCQHSATKRHYESTKQVYINRAKKRNKLISDSLRENLIEYLKKHPCVDCGETDIVVLEFDHLRDKVENIAIMMSQRKTWEQILAEIEKCEVVCANCHRRRTARRSNWTRYRSVV